MKRGFICALNHVSMYHMPFCMPLRLDVYNNLLNKYQKELCYRDNYLLIENIAPVGKGGYGLIITVSSIPFKSSYYYSVVVEDKTFYDLLQETL